MTISRRTKRTFSPEFKLEAVEQVVKYQRDVRDSISILTIYANGYGCISWKFKVIKPLISDGVEYTRNLLANFPMKGFHINIIIDEGIRLYRNQIGRECFRHSLVRNDTPGARLPD